MISKISKILIALLFICDTYAQGSCSSPDGGMLFISEPPTDYQYLEDNGYCLNGTGSTSWHTMCFTFTPTVGDVAINMGYNSSCVNTSFGAFTLYDNTCTEVGNGLTFNGLNATEEYTWCVLMRAWGGAGCNGFETACPYWMDNTALSVDVISKSCQDQTVKWSTASEINNYKWVLTNDNGEIGSIYSNGDSNTVIEYAYKVDCYSQYVNILSVDNDGRIEDNGTVYCDCEEEQSEVMYMTILGQDCQDCKGLVLKGTKINNQWNYSIVLR